MKFAVAGDYDAVMNRLFGVFDAGIVTIGTARSQGPVTSLECLEEWTLFSDYVMEGFVTYQLRTSKRESSVIIEVRLLGTNRDQYIPSAFKHSLKSVGLEATEAES